MVGLLTGALFGPAQRLLAPAAAPMLAQAAPQASGGLLSMFAPQAAQSPFYRAFDQRRDTITNMLLGGVGAESPLERMRGMAAGVVEGRKSDTSTKQANQTAQWLSQQFGLSPEDAFVAVRNPDVMKFYLKSKGGVDAPASVEEWNHFNALSEEDQGRYLRMKRASPYLDVGTGFVTPNPVQPGAVDGPAIPKDNYGAKFQGESGTQDAKAMADAKASLGTARQSAAMVRAQVESLKNDPYLPRMLGPMDSRLPNVSADAARVQSKIDQLQGGAFLQAYQMLKGGGQITEVEGIKAEAAMARLNTAQNEADFKSALNEFAQAVEEGVRKLEAAAERGEYVPATTPPPTAPQRLRFNPATGELE